MTDQPSNGPTPRQTAVSRNIVNVGSFQRPQAERPLHDSIDGIAQWLVGEARRSSPFLTQTFDELAWRLIAAGMPLLRASLHSGTLHPQFSAPPICGGATPLRP